MTIVELWNREYRLADGRCALCNDHGLLRCQNGTMRYCLCSKGRFLRKEKGPMATERTDDKQTVK